MPAATHSLRCGLHSFAASRLEGGELRLLAQAVPAERDGGGCSIAAASS